MNELSTIGIVSPGAMGGALGRGWQAHGARVVATVEGRSERTAGLARGLELLPTLREVVSAADLVVSICPPGAAVDVAIAIAIACSEAQARPLVADLNAISPATVIRVSGLLSTVGCELVDGSISGSPPEPGTDTIVYFSGARAAALAALPIDGAQAQVVGSELGMASAVKMCTASVYKGFSALLTQALQTAHHHQITETVLADLRRDYPDHIDHAARSLANAASKSDRYPAEMREIAQAQHDAGAERALFEAMALVYERVNRTVLARRTPEAAAATTDLEVVLDCLARSA